LKVTYTEEAVADIVEAITYLNERNPTHPDIQKVGRKERFVDYEHASDLPAVGVLDSDMSKNGGKVPLAR
jgi:hypothetical protein